MKLIRLIRFAGIALAMLLFTARAGAQPDARAVAAKLDSLQPILAKELTAELQRTNLTGSYTVVWRAYEDAVIAALEKILPQHLPELTATNFDTGTTGREKNRLADFAIVCGTNAIEFSIKAARGSGNPENDMGTFRDHPNRQKLFSDAFTVWVRYDDSGKAIRCDRVFFDRTWRFVGKSTLVDGVKYRKKDGNMRPKPWTMFDAGEGFWKNEGDFEAAVKRAKAFRANEVVAERLKELSEEDQRALYEKLREKFAAPAKP